MTKCRTTHHHACACREARFERMERALKVIQIWASMPAPDEAQILRDIEQQCKDALRYETMAGNDYRPLPGDEDQ